MREKVTIGAYPAFTIKGALQAWAEITKALVASPDPADRKLSKSIVHFVMQTDVARAVHTVPRSLKLNCRA